MKKLIFGITLMVCGTAGSLALIFKAIDILLTLGDYDTYSNILYCLHEYGIAFLLVIFLAMLAAGTVIAAADVFGKKPESKKSIIL